jgi:acyl-CoA synthetase (AMP-forming)/AMP-acid ligase II
MMASILGHLEGLAEKHPDKLLFSYLDVSGESLESYSYASFLERAQAIAGHLLQEKRFAAGDRLLLAYPPGLEMICAFFGCIRAGLIPVPVYPPSSRGFQSALYKMVHIAKDCQAAGVLTSHDYHASLKTNLARSSVASSGVDAEYMAALPWIPISSFSNTPPVRRWSPRASSSRTKISLRPITSSSTIRTRSSFPGFRNITTWD